MTTFFSSVVRYVLLGTALVQFLPSPIYSEDSMQMPGNDATAATLVQAALERELTGHNDQRMALLQAAAQKSPGNPNVHWQLGEVRGDDNQNWLTTTQMENIARQDRRLAEYRQLRDKTGPSLPEQIALAQWCNKNKLDNEERVHWLLVLQVQPKYPDAVQRLGALQRSGITQTGVQIAQAANPQKPVAFLGNWQDFAANWMKAIERGETEPPPEIRKTVANLATSGDILALQRAMGQEAGKKQQKLHSLALALAKALNDNPHPAAAECLSRLAVFSEWGDVREASIAGLKRHPIDHYVPLMLAALQSTIDADVRFDVDGNGNLISNVQLYREGDLADYSHSQLQSPMPAPIISNKNPHLNDPINTNSYNDGRDIPGNIAAWQKTETPIQLATQKAFPNLVVNWQAEEKARYVATQRQRQAEKMQAKIQAYMDGVRMETQRRLNALNSRAIAGKKAAALYDEIENYNQAIEKTNTRVVSILKETTGKDVGDAPKEWWKWWWNTFNETDAVVDTDDSSSDNAPPTPYDYAPNKPVIPSYAVQRYQGYTPIPSPPISASTFTASAPPTSIVVTSCFAPDTKVWTQTGKLAIEKVKVGDRVLAQNVDSGELAYKPVLAITTRPPHERLKIGAGADSITATPGHPFWVNGKNWQLAKQLEIGQILHAVSGGSPIESIEKLETDPTSAGFSYNLVVADFSSYFVGEQGILVHDNTPRQPTSARIPGLPAE